MAKLRKKCRICDKEYETCSNAEKYDGVFRWPVVACSPECGAIYFERYIGSQENKTECDELFEDAEKDDEDAVDTESPIFLDVKKNKNRRKYSQE